MELTSGPTQDMDYLEQVNKYKVVVAPLLHMMKPGVAKRIEEFTAIAPLFETCGEIELSTRIGKDSNITFVINHGDTEGQLKLGNI